MAAPQFEVDNTDKYHKIKPLPKGWGYYASLPFKAIRNIPAYALGRVLGILIFNPLATLNPEHDHRQFQQSSDPDPLHKGDFAVINVTEKPSFVIRVVRNYMRRLRNTVRPPEFIERFMQRQVLRINQIDEAKCDEVIDNVLKHLDGQSLADKRIHKVTADNIFIKGTEFIDPALRERFFNALNGRMRQRDDVSENFDIRNNQKGLNFYTLESRDGSVLDSCEVQAPGEADKQYQNRTFVISCMPRSNNYTAWLKRHKIYAEQIGTTYISFNYRGVERSRGLIWTENDMVKDAVAQAERLLALGAKPQNIAFEGECLGAAIATMAAAKMNKKGFDVKLFNTRSFRTATKLVLYKILPGENANLLNPLNWLRYLAAGVFLLIGNPLLKITGWNMNAASAYDSIPDANKGFLNAANDPMVEGSHVSILSLMQEHGDDAANSHLFEAEAAQDGAKPTVRNTHTCPLNQLNCGGQDARQYKINFFRQVFSKPNSDDCQPSIQETPVNMA